MSDVFELVLAETNERLDRIETALGITERTEAGKALDALLEREGLAVNGRDEKPDPHAAAAGGGM